MAHPLVYLGAALLGGLAAAAVDYYMPDRHVTIAGVTLEAGALAAGLALVAGTMFAAPFLLAMAVGGVAFEGGKIGAAHLLPSGGGLPPALPSGAPGAPVAGVGGIDYDDVSPDELMQAFDELGAT